jgi:uncharacterized protein YhfF
MSLAAAVAVAGLTSTVSAKNLEDAIKGVEVSGYIDYRLENKAVDDKVAGNADKSANVNEYAVNVTAKTKINDIVSGTVSIGFDEVTTDNENDELDIALEPQDADPALKVSNAYFTFDMGMVSVMAGKQNIPSAFVDKSDTAKAGAGVVALAKVSDALTLAAAHFTNNNIDKVYGGSKLTGGNATYAAEDTKTSELVAMGAVGPVSYGVHYNMTDVAYIDGGVEADALYVTASVKAGPAKITVEHAQASADSNTVKWADSSVSNVTADVKAGPASISATYFMADKELGTNDLKTDVALDGDNDAVAHVKVWQLSTTAISNKGDGFAVNAGMTFGSVSANLVYAAATNDAIANDATSFKTDLTETMVMATYKMSPNFKLHARYSILDTDSAAPNSAGDSETTYSRLQANFTF